MQYRHINLVDGNEGACQYGTYSIVHRAPLSNDGLIEGNTYRFNNPISRILAVGALFK